MSDEAPVPTLAAAAAASRLAAAGLDGWRVEGGEIRRTYLTEGWPQTLLVVGAIAFACEAAWHHPDLLVRWGAVEVRLTTHSAGGITDLDVAMARRIEDVVLDRPGPDSPLAGNPGDLVRGQEG